MSAEPELPCFLLFLSGSGMRGLFAVWSMERVQESGDVRREGWDRSMVSREKRGEGGWAGGEAADHRIAPCEMKQR